MTSNGDSRATVAIIGGGPAALTAAHALRGRPGLRVVLVSPGGLADHLPGVLAVATGDAPLTAFRTPIRAAGLEVIPGRVTRMEPGRLRIGDTDLAVDAVIAAPGLSTDRVAPTVHNASWDPQRPRIVSFWDLDGAEEAAATVAGFDEGILTVAIASPLYRCPPAPYGLAIRLARRATARGHDVRVRLTTPEPRPLAKIGESVSAFLAASCADAGVEVVHDVTPDPDALGKGEVVDTSGSRHASDLVVAVPAHRSHELLRDLAGPDQLVVVDDGGRAGDAGWYVAGDAVAGPFPRAVSPAVVSALRAVRGVCEDFDLDPVAEPGLPEPDCFVDQGDGFYTRLQITYPDGAPPQGAPAVVIGERADAATGGFDTALARWRSLCRPEVP